jgi:hypothetical protein
VYGCGIATKKPLHEASRREQGKEVGFFVASRNPLLSSQHTSSAASQSAGSLHRCSCTFFAAKTILETSFFFMSGIPQVEKIEGFGDLSGSLCTGSVSSRESPDSTNDSTASAEERAARFRNRSRDRGRRP